MTRHVFRPVGKDFPNTCRDCACFRNSVNHFPDMTGCGCYWSRESGRFEPCGEQHEQAYIEYLEQKKVTMKDRTQAEIEEMETARDLQIDEYASSIDWAERQGHINNEFTKWWDVYGQYINANLSARAQARIAFQAGRRDSYPPKPLAKGTIVCPGCGCLAFVRDNRTVVAHYAPNGYRCGVSETLVEKQL